MDAELLLDPRKAPVNETTGVRTSRHEMLVAWSATDDVALPDDVCVETLRGSDEVKVVWLVLTSPRLEGAEVVDEVGIPCSHGLLEDRGRAGLSGSVVEELDPRRMLPWCSWC